MPKIRKNYQIEQLQESEVFLLIRALESYSGQWHDKQGFRWKRTGVHVGAKKLHDELCRQIGLDVNNLVVVQKQVK